MDKFSFVILSDYISQTKEDIKDLNLTIIENESDLDLGYFTVTGNSDNINEFKSFINGTSYI